MKIQPETLKLLRKLRNWSQQELADKAKLDKKTIGRIEGRNAGESHGATIRLLAGGRTGGSLGSTTACNECDYRVS